MIQAVEQTKAGHVADLAELRYLDPANLQLCRHGAVLRVTIIGERSYPTATAARILPVSDPGRYVSLRDGSGQEIGIVVDPEELEPESRAALAAELTRRYVRPIILAVEEARERFGSVEWSVRTDRGKRRFTTRQIREHCISPAPGRYLLADVDGNVYEIPDLAALDGDSRATLMRYL